MFVGPSDIMFGRRKGGKICNIITPFGPIKRPYLLCIAGYTHIQHFTEHAFPHLSDHQTSFQVFCRYVYCTVDYAAGDQRWGTSWAVTEWSPSKPGRSCSTSSGSNTRRSPSPSTLHCSSASSPSSWDGSSRSPIYNW